MGGFGADEALDFNYFELMRYPPGSCGISPHRDHAENINIVCVFCVGGHGIVYGCDDRAGALTLPPHQAGCGQLHSRAQLPLRMRLAAPRKLPSLPHWTLSRCPVRLVSLGAQAAIPSSTPRTRARWW